MQFSFKKISHIIFHLRLDLPRKYEIRPFWWQTDLKASALTSSMLYTMIGAILSWELLITLAGDVVLLTCSHACWQSLMFLLLTNPTVFVQVHYTLIVCSDYNIYIDRPTRMYWDTIFIDATTLQQSNIAFILCVVHKYLNPIIIYAFFCRMSQSILWLSQWPASVERTAS